MDWTWIDWLLAGIIFLSTLISLVRGFTREVLSLVTWVIAIWVAIKFTTPVAEFFREEITSAQLRVIVVFVGLFIVTLIAGSLVNYIISRLVVSTGLSGTDRLLGSVFGIARGVLVAVLLIVTGGFTPLVNQLEWKQSKLIPAFAPITQWLLSYIPQEGTVSWLNNPSILSGTKPSSEKKSSTKLHPEPSKKSASESPFPDRAILEAKEN